LRESLESVTTSLCEQIFHRPIFWTKATDFSPSPTHFIDFGPGGASGIGALTARNFEGKGAVSILMGKNPELYDSQSFRSADRWSDIWSPKLIRLRYENLTKFAIPSIVFI
jgi:fatty acid synthase subunit beta